LRHHRQIELLPTTLDGHDDLLARTDADIAAHVVEGLDLAAIDGDQ
jgi:hypothetical protein